MWMGMTRFPIIGYYGVYLFFIISGFSLYIGYHKRIEKISDITPFLAVRFFRIAPLVILVTLATCFSFSNPTLFLQNLPNIFLTMSLLFGLGVPAATSTITGGWSLGIEFVYYIGFPVFLSFFHSIKRTFFILIMIFLTQLMIVNWSFSMGEKLQDLWWYFYINPLSFLFYFFFGMFFAFLFLKKKEFFLNQNKTLKRILQSISTLLLFFWFCSKRDVAEHAILEGISGFFNICICCFIFVMFVITNNRSNASKIFSFLGSVSYGVYLIHPVVYFKLLSKIKIGNLDRIFLSIVITTALAYISHKFIEMPMLAYAKRRFGHHKTH